MSVRKKTARSGIVVGISSMTVEVGRFVSMVVLARLLEPTDFGIVTLATIFITIGSLLSELGLQQALIATHEEPNKVAFHVLVMTLVSGVVMTLLIFALAPPFASVFGQEQLTPICRVMSLMIVFNALFVAPSALLAKDMAFGRLFVPNTLAPLSGMVVGVVMGYAGFGLWSLVSWQIVGSVVAFVAVMAVCPSYRWLRPHQWDIRLAKELIRIGVTNVGTGIVSFGFFNLDKIVVGKFFGAAALGFYSQAYRLANLPVDSITTVFNRVLLPAYAQIRNDSDRLATAFLNSFRMLSVVTIPIGMGMLILAPELVIVLFGEKWKNTIPLLQILALLTLIRPLSLATVPLFMSVNRPDYSLRTVLIIFVSMGVLIFTVLPLGLSALAMAVVCAIGLGLAHNLHIACSRIDKRIGWRDVVLQIWPVVLASLIMMGSIAVTKQLLLPIAGVEYIALWLMIFILVAMVTYGLALFAINRIFFFEVLEVLRLAIGRRGRTGNI